MVFCYYRERTEQPKESTLWDRFLWLNLIGFCFSSGDNFFHFLALKHVSTVHFKAVLSQTEHSVCTLLHVCGTKCSPVSFSLPAEVLCGVYCQEAAALPQKC